MCNPFYSKISLNFVSNFESFLCGNKYIKCILNNANSFQFTLEQNFSELIFYISKFNKKLNVEKTLKKVN